MKPGVIIAIIAVILVAIIIMWAGKQGTGPENSARGTNQASIEPVEKTSQDEVRTSEMERSEENKSESAVKEYMIIITDSGYSPQALEVKRGEKVTWVNRGSSSNWPASAMHPTHRVYPGSGIEKCGTEEKIFDSCRGLNGGESWSFTFNEKGNWNYHNHLNSGMHGSILVS